jgi:hypothetical protein
VGPGGEVAPGKVKFVLRLNGKGHKAESAPAELEIVAGEKK